jgi:hypothetical protein
MSGAPLPDQITSLSDISELMFKGPAGLPGAYSSIISEINNGTLVGTGLNITNINRMIGFSNSQEISFKSAEEFSNISLARTQNFYTFWNQLNSDKDFVPTGSFQIFGFGALGTYFSDFTNENGASSTKINDAVTQTYNFVYTRNVFVTYILILVFNGILGSTDGINPTGSLDIFTSPSDAKRFSVAIINLRAFMDGCQGLGNYRVGIGSLPPSGTNPMTKGWNSGFVSTYCMQKFKDNCPDETDQLCLQNYRKKLSNTPTALDWCGCYTPLPTFVEDAFNSAKVTPFPNRCDPLCFPNGVFGFYQTPFGQKFSGDVISEQGRKLDCTPATICIIDNNSVNAVNTTGHVDFNQICKCPPGNACLCYLDVSDTGVLDNVHDNNGGGMLNQSRFKQNCTNAICYKIDDKGNYTPVKCNEINTPSTGGVFNSGTDGLSETEKYEKIFSEFWYFLFIGLSIFIIFLFAYFESHHYLEERRE